VGWTYGWFADEVLKMRLQLFSFASDLLGGRLSFVTILEHNPPDSNRTNHTGLDTCTTSLRECNYDNDDINDNCVSYTNTGRALENASSP